MYCDRTREYGQSSRVRDLVPRFAIVKRYGNAELNYTIMTLLNGR